MKTTISVNLLSLLASSANGWQHASDAELVRAGMERTKPLLVAYIFSKETSSQNLEWQWARAEALLQKEHIDADVMSIDCSASLSTCLKMDVKAYPAIRLYLPDGRSIPYRGPRRSKPIVAFIQRAKRPKLLLLKTTEQVASFITSDEIVFTAEFTPTEALLYEAHYRQLAERYHDRYSFGLILSSNQARIDQHQTQPATKQSISRVKCYNAQTSDSFTLTSAELPLPSAFDELITQCTAPLIYEPVGRKQLADLAKLSATNARSGLIVHFFITSDSPSTEDLEDLKERYKKEIAPLAKKYNQEILFTIIDGDEHPGMRPTVGGLSSDVGSGVSVENVRTGELFPYLSKHYRQAGKNGDPRNEVTKSDITAGQLEWFLGEIVEGRVQPWNGQEVDERPNKNRPTGDQSRRHDEL